MRQFCASAFIINPLDKKILLVKHKKFDKWVQPGGHIEPDELPEETAVREVYEETKIKIKLLGVRFPRENDCIRPLGIQKNLNKVGEVHIDIIYPAVPLNPYNCDPVISEESTEAGWFSLNDLENISVFPDIKITMEYILKYYFNIK